MSLTFRLDGGGEGPAAPRAGTLTTGRGSVPTPTFMPVGTLASVKALTPEEVAATGARITLVNAYHLYLRPGHRLIESLGGVHRFMGWEGPILSDSGGFQVFSLAKLVRVDDEGVRFRSHLDGFRAPLHTRARRRGAERPRCRHRHAPRPCSPW